MITLTIYYDSRPSKWRNALPLIRDNGFEQKKIEFMKHNSSRFRLYYILKKLQMFRRDIFRHSAPLYKKLNLQTRQLVNYNINNLIKQFPKLFKCPILVLEFMANVKRSLENKINLYQAVKI